MKVLALDFEGSHLSTERGCPIQLGIAVMDDGQVIASDEFLLQVPKHYQTGRATREVDAYALQVSGLTIERIEAEGLEPVAACQRLDAFIAANQARSLRVLCFNVSYDLACYRNMLLFASDWHPVIRGKRAPFREILGANWTCVMATARHLAKDLDDYKLDTVAAHCGLAREGQFHGALEDAILAGKIYHRLAEKAAAGEAA